MRIFRSYGNTPDSRAIAEAVEAMRDGQIIIYPTDTLYAFGCDGLNNKAIEKLCRLKGIDASKNLLSIVCADISEAAEYARIDNTAFRILKRCLPGPFTFILPASLKLPKVFKGRKSVGIRIPDNAFALELARELGGPVMTSSATADEDCDICDAENLALKYDGCPGLDITIDGGRGNSVGSTVVDLTNSAEPIVVRQGLGEYL
ncbi:MAG: threonylcarbamoyl-AMP synthase [Muribaculaceae bacterium]|nr:threonylcarbamoyl-AMP synthase [Muribaculaceae bacterium]